MEKVIYALWRRDGEARDDLNARLLEETGPALLAIESVHGLRLNLQDAAVTRAEPLRQMGTDPQMDAVAQLWLDASHAAFRGPIDALLESAAARIAAWAVVESTIIPNALHPSREGERTNGWSQFCFIQQPQSLGYDRWLHNWQGLHTQVAIDTQSNFEYLQNRVVSTLIDGPHSYVAIVEEAFPTDAMDDPAVFFDAVDDPSKFAANTRAMAESCARFIDIGNACGIDVLPTSQYELRKLH